MSFYREVSSQVQMFQVFVPLVEGFGGGESQATLADVVEVFETWMKQRGNAKQPYFTGIVTGGKGAKDQPTLVGVFGWHNDDSSFTAMHEENAVIQISTHPELHRDLKPKDFEEMLLSLATAFGERFKQKRIYVMDVTGGKLTIFQESGSRTPTQLT